MKFPDREKDLEQSDVSITDINVIVDRTSNCSTGPRAGRVIRCPDGCGQGVYFDTNRRGKVLSFDQGTVWEHICPNKEKVQD